MPGIATKLHKLSNKTLRVVAGHASARGVEHVIAKWHLFPSLVLTHDVLQMAENALDSGAFFATVSALKEAGVYRLPYPITVVESPASVEGDVRLICFAQEGYAEKYGGFFIEVSVATLLDDTAIYFDHAVALTPHSGDDPETCVWAQDIGEDGVELVRRAAGTVLTAIFLLGMDGVHADTVEAPAALNKAREKRGETAIPKHTVLSIKHVLDREGRRVPVTALGRHVAIHMRAGHVRRQPHGPKHSLRKKIFIPPVLVNYKPDASVPVPHKVLVP